ncbi:MAG: isoprenylcysteine carboxylmethyltransferase family protein [Terracidiphilus sp.]
MAHATALSVIGYVWEALGLVWLAGLAFTKRTVLSQATGSRLFHMAVILLGFTLLGSTLFSAGWLGEDFLAPSQGLQIAGLILTIGGCLFAIWARIALGRNWSGRATVKAGHELIVSGPYSLARHPIYTGLLLASVGTALAFAEWRCILGLALIVSGFAAKIGQEEKLMMQAFPDAYPRYRQRVKALIPGLL